MNMTSSNKTIETKNYFFLILLLTFVTSCKESENKQLLNSPSEKYSPQIIEEEKTPFYKIIKENDISYRIGFDINNPINKRFTYRVLVKSKIKRNQIDLLLNKLLIDITTKDKDIDEITIWLYSDIKFVDGIYDIGTATWQPSDGNVTTKIATTNNRDSYKLKITIPDNVEQIIKHIDEESLSKKVDELIIGRWEETNYTNTKLIIYKKNNKIFIKTVDKDGNFFSNELKQQKNSKGIRYDYKEGGFNGEYFILNKNNKLEFYNMLNEKFTEALPE